MNRIGLLAVLSLTIATVAGANLVINGDFSTGDETGWTRIPGSPWAPDFRWDATGGIGTMSLSVGSIGWYQRIDAPAGDYTLAALWEGDLGGAGWQEVMFFTVADADPDTEIVSRFDIGNATDIAFKKDSWGLNPPDSWTFESASLSPASGGNGGAASVAAGQDLVVALKVGHGGGVGAIGSFDDIVVVPEPATLALGLAGLGLILRRRRP